WGTAGPHSTCPGAAGTAKVPGSLAPSTAPRQLLCHDSLDRQDTPSRAEQDREQSGSTATAGSGQMQQAGPSEAAAGERCPICLGTTRNTAYTYTCFHAFCFRCIRRWAATSSACPLCRQPIDRILCFFPFLLPLLFLVR
uniref:RING-type E3 ubiquitin transferase n=1 Tax=Anas platyrhynchos TaxID=8839 RepID=A0A8B9R1M4_ANAPL